VLARALPKHLDRKLQERRTFPVINIPAPRRDAPRARRHAPGGAAAEDAVSGAGIAKAMEAEKS